MDWLVETKPSFVLARTRVHKLAKSMARDQRHRQEQLSRSSTAIEYMGSVYLLPVEAYIEALAEQTDRDEPTRLSMEISTRRKAGGG